MVLFFVVLLFFGVVFVVCGFWMIFVVVVVCEPLPPLQQQSAGCEEYCFLCFVCGLGCLLVVDVAQAVRNGLGGCLCV